MPPVIAWLLLLLLLLLVELVVMAMWYVGVLGVISFVDDLRWNVIVNELHEVVTAVRAPAGRVLDRWSSCAHELLQVGLGRQTALLQSTRTPKKPMQLGSPNLTQKRSTMTPENAFILGSNGQRSRLRVIKTLPA